MKGKTVLVVGDFILDYYRILKSKGQSPESETLMFKPERDEFRLGGAGNVYRNLEALGIRARLATVVGNICPCVPDLDGGWHTFVGLPAGPLIVTDDTRLTTTKERLVTRRQQLLRVDIQSDKPITMEAARSLVSSVNSIIHECDAIIFSDYAHGVCIPEVVQPILNKAIELGKPTIVDSKAKDSLTKYRGCTIALPNSSEAKEITKLDDFDDTDVGKFMLRTMKMQAAAITQGPAGILLITPEGSKHFPTLCSNVEEEVADVTGAGDTVAAIVAAGLSVGLPYDRIMRLANVAAGVKVQKRGVATATPDEIMSAASSHGMDI